MLNVYSKNNEESNTFKRMNFTKSKILLKSTQLFLSKGHFSGINFMLRPFEMLSKSLSIPLILAGANGNRPLSALNLFPLLLSTHPDHLSLSSDHTYLSRLDLFTELFTSVPDTFDSQHSFH